MEKMLFGLFNFKAKNLKIIAPTFTMAGSREKSALLHFSRYKIISLSLS